MTVQGLRRPAWWEGDFDTTGKTQLGWAVEAAAAYREAMDLGVTRPAPSVTPSVTRPKSVTPSVTPSKGALRIKRWRERKQALAHC